MHISFYSFNEEGLYMVIDRSGHFSTSKYSHKQAEYNLKRKLKRKGKLNHV
jgi:hypothetical protein